MREMALKAYGFECLFEMMALNASGFERLTEEK